MKTIGGILVIGATSLWGHAAAEKVRSSYKELLYLQKLLYLKKCLAQIRPGI